MSFRAKNNKKKWNESIDGGKHHNTHSHIAATTTVYSRLLFIRWWLLKVLFTVLFLGVNLRCRLVTSFFRIRWNCTIQFTQVCWRRRRCSACRRPHRDGFQTTQTVPQPRRLTVRKHYWSVGSDRPRSLAPAPALLIFGLLLTDLSVNHGWT